MDMLYDDYTDFVNDLFMQEFLDFEYHTGHSDSTVDSLAIL